MQQKDERTWGVLIHLAGIIGTMLLKSVGGIIAPLALWLIKRNESTFIDDQGKEALNFQISVALVSTALGIIGNIQEGIWSMSNFVFRRAYFSLDMTDWGIISVLLLIVWIGNIIYSVSGAMKANSGIPYRYPFSWRLVK